MRTLIFLLSAFLAGLLAGPILALILPLDSWGCKYRGEIDSLPEDLAKALERLRFVNAFTGEVLKEYRLVGGVVGSYEPDGEIYETYILGFEDRPSSASADQDFLDVIVEFKRVRGSSEAVVRVVQLGHDSIDVYLDGKFLGSIRPGLELSIDLSSG